MNNKQDNSNDFIDPLADMAGDMGIGLAWCAGILIVAAIVGMIILVHYT